jgi:hypothetical protein
MAATTTELGLVTPTQGTLSGTWGDTVNYGITEYVNIAIAGTLSFAGDGAITLANTTGNASASNIGSTTAQYMVIRITGTQTVTKVITGPSYSKLYMVDHAGATSAVTFKASGQTGVSIAVGEKCFVYFNGTDYVKIATSTAGTGSVTSVAQSFTGGLISVGGSPITTSGTLALTVAGTSGGIPYFSSASTWATSAALTQYGVVYGGGAGATPVATAAGTTGQVLTATTGGAPTWITPAAGVSLSANNTWTGTQTFSGSSSIFGTSLLDSNETVNVVAAAPSSTTNFYVQSGSVQYYTTSAANNWTLNIAFSSGTSMNTALATGQSVTFTLVTTQGSTAYYNNAVTIDGTSVTPKWIGGAPTAGNASGLDVYRFAVVKTASATYTVLASLTQYK